MKPEGFRCTGSHYGRPHGKHAREYRRTDAKERTEARAKRSAEQQIAILDARLGVGKGAAKERARLNK